MLGSRWGRKINYETESGKQEHFLYMGHLDALEEAQVHSTMVKT
jgi:hypothetical protein